MKNFFSFFSQDIANLLKYPEHAEYIIWFGMIVGVDAISSMALAQLRLKEKAKKFALINFLNVGVNIGLNLFFILSYLFFKARRTLTFSL